MSPLAFAGALLAPLAAGAGALLLLGIRPRDGRVAFAGHAWIAGTLALGALTFAVALFGGGFGALPWLGGGAALLAFAVGWRRARKAVPEPARSAARAGSDGALWLVLALVLALAGDDVLRGSRPLVTVGDEGSIYANRAMALYHAGGYGPEFAELARRDDFVAHPDYPPLNPLLMTWTFACAGEVLHLENRLFIQTFVFALLALMAVALRRVSGGWTAALVLFVFAGARALRGSSRVGPADVMTACGLAAALDAWLQLRASGERRHAALLGIALAFLAWTKQEGLLLAGGIGAAALWKRRHLAVLLLPPALAAAAHAAVNARFGFRGDLLAEADGATWFERLTANAGHHCAVVLRQAADLALFNPGETNLLLACAALLFVLAPRTVFRVAAVPAVVLLAGSAAFLGAYLVTPHPIEWHVQTSLVRLVLQVLPAAALVVAAVVGRCLLRAGAPPSQAASASSADRGAAA